MGESQIKKQGESAFRAGKLVTENPFEKAQDPAEYYTWQDGWFTASRDVRAEVGTNKENESLNEGVGSTAWAQGFDSYQASQFGGGTCPYPDRSIEAEDWNMGYNQAKSGDIVHIPVRAKPVREFLSGEKKMNKAEQLLAIIEKAGTAAWHQGYEAYPTRMDKAGSVRWSPEEKKEWEAGWRQAQSDAKKFAAEEGKEGADRWMKSIKLVGKPAKLWEGANGGGLPSKSGFLAKISQSDWDSMEKEWNEEWWKYAHDGVDAEDIEDDEDPLKYSETVYDDAGGWVILADPSTLGELAKDVDKKYGIVYFNTKPVKVTVDGKEYAMIAGVSGV